MMPNYAESLGGGRRTYCLVSKYPCRLGNCSGLGLPVNSARWTTSWEFYGIVTNVSHSQGLTPAPSSYF